MKASREAIAMSLEKNGREYLEPVVGSALYTAKTEGKAEMLLRLLRRKFGELPEEAIARVRAASREDLDSWADSILFADSLDKVLANGSAR